MTCSPARVSSPMNGAVFHVSAMMTAALACQPSVDQRIWVPSIWFAMPLASKIQRHSSADTTVGMAHAGFFRRTGAAPVGASVTAMEPSSGRGWRAEGPPPRGRRPELLGEVLQLGLQLREGRVGRHRPGEGAVRGVLDGLRRVAVA